MTAVQGCALLLVVTSVLQILPVTVGWTCPPPQAGSNEVTIIVTKKTDQYFGTIYRFQKQLPSSTGNWDLITGNNGNPHEDVSYFKAYDQSIAPEYKGLGIIGVTRWLKCGGFEMRVRVCRVTRQLSQYSYQVQFDYLTAGDCQQADRRLFDFYVADEARDYERTRRYRSGKCIYDSNEWAGVITHASFSSSCEDVQNSFSFHALPGRKMCERIDRAPPSSSIIGSTTEDAIWQESLDFRCYTGYEISPGITQQSIFCTGGQWNALPQPCNKVQCGDPPEVENGHYSGPNNDYGSSVSLQCDEGHEIPDTYYSRIQCQADGTWTQSSSVCQAVSCGHPGAPQNGDVHGDSYSYQGEVSFTCDQGYWREGPETLHCQADGHWNEYRPVCNRKVCDAVFPPNNGMKIGQDLGTGSSLIFRCYDGFLLVGEERITCEEVEGRIEGTWNNPVPICERVTCSAPTAPENGVVIGDDFSYDATVTFRCHPGYRRQGTMLARCGLSGEWDTPTPTCTAVECRALTAPENGEMSSDSSSFGSHVDFSCHEGYTIVGHSSLTCTETGRWSDNVPSCQAVECPELPPIENGVRIGSTGGSSGQGFGIVVEFQCFPGYQLVGATDTACQSNRQWTNSVPICEICPRNSYKEGANANQCQECPEHSTTLTDASPSIDHCNCRDGYIRMDDYSCLPVNCAPLSPPQNGSISEDCSTDFGGTCTFYCDPGFVLSSGGRTVSCQANGWSGAPPICNECPRNTYKETVGSLTCHPCPRNSHTFGRAGTSRDSCVCTTGYQAAEDNSVCNDINECETENGGCSDECVNTMGSYYCQCSISGYQLEADGQTCVAVRSCEALDPAMINGELTCHETVAENANICYITCNAGYFFVSGQNDYVTCGPEYDWVWSHRLVNASANLPACTEEFYVDMKLALAFEYSLGAGECNNLGLFEERLKATISEGIETMEACKGRCWISDISLLCEEPENQTESQSSQDSQGSTLTASCEMYLINFEEDAVGPDCDITCRSLNLREMYRDAFLVLTALRGIVEGSGAELEISGEDAPAVISDSLTHGNPNILCKKPGHVLTKNRLCVPCAPGTYLAQPDRDMCDPCPEGSYSMHEAATECQPCLEGTTTATTGADHPAMCSERVEIIAANPAGISRRRRRSVERIADEDIDIDEVLAFLDK